jgi:hypothetical protein
MLGKKRASRWVVERVCSKINSRLAIIKSARSGALCVGEQCWGLNTQNKLIIRAGVCVFRRGLNPTANFARTQVCVLSASVLYSTVVLLSTATCSGVFA